MMQTGHKQYEVLDTNEDLKVGDDLEWNGEDGLTNDWGVIFEDSVDASLSGLTAVFFICKITSLYSASVTRLDKMFSDMGRLEMPTQGCIP